MKEFVVSFSSTSIAESYATPNEKSEISNKLDFAFYYHFYRDNIDSAFIAHTSFEL